MTQDDATRLVGDGPAGESPGGIQVPGFRILRKLGEGGMGVVFEAEQESPRRRVALKLVRGGGLADDLRTRLFKREADLLARLEHPGIAAIYASGRTPAGHDWFAMELVEGETLGAWMTRTGTVRPRSAESLRDRLELFRGICDAVSYAHQRGVIHRDLKPSNLVVVARDAVAQSEATAFPARSRVKVLDFGLARLVDPDPAGDTMASHPGAVRGTLQYMSPEQARGDVDAVDVRTDVYALGVILWELLANRRPYDLPSGLLEAVRTITETAPRALADGWPGPGRADADLETIARKALAKDAADRYSGAAELGEDVRRWLASEPILARPPSTLYQLRKLVARRRGPFLAAAAMLLLVVAAAVVSTTLYLRSERNLARAEAAEARARSEAQTAQETSDFLASVFDVARPDRARSDQLTAREILENAAQRVQGELGNDPVARARLMGTIGDVTRRLGLVDRAQPLLEGSLRLLEEKLPPDAAEVAIARNRVGQLREDLGDFDGAAAAFEKAIAGWTARGDTTGAPFAAALANYGGFLGNADKDREALPYLERARAVLEGLGTSDSREIGNLLSTMSTVKIDIGDLPGAAADLERAADILRKLGQEHSLAFANVTTNQGVVRTQQEDLEGALESFRVALKLREEFLDPDNPEVLESRGNLAAALAQSGRFDEARVLLESMVAQLERKFGPDHPLVAQTRFNLGHLLVESGHPEEAREHLLRALRVQEKLYGRDATPVGGVLYSLAEANRLTGRLADARAQLERVIAIDESPGSLSREDLPEDLESLITVLQALGDGSAVRAAEAKRDSLRAAVSAAAK